MKLRRIFLWTMIILAFSALFLFIGGMVYVVKAKYALNDYTMQVGFGFNAAMMVNAEETHMDADKAVIAQYEGKRVVIVDDVISTGESLSALEQLVEQAGGTVVARAAILAEGDAAKRDDIIFLNELPLFFPGKNM